MSKKDALTAASVVVTVAGIFSGNPALAAYGSYIRGAQVALILYGLYDGYRQSQKARQAFNASLTDKTAQVNSLDSPRSIVYGRRVISGRPVFVVEPRDETEQYPAQRYFWMVYALECSHEVNKIEEIYFNGEPVGPYLDDPSTVPMTQTAAGSKYYWSRTGSGANDGIVAGGGAITLPKPVKAVMSLILTPPGAPNYNRPEEADVTAQQAVTITNPLFGFNVVEVDPKYDGWNYRINWTYETVESKVAVWFYRGTNEQTANDALRQVAPEWTTSCKLTGTPYVIVRIEPELDLFPSGPPTITALVQGRKVFDPVTGLTQYSANPVLHLRDYLVNECGVLPEEINDDLLLAARNACEENVFYSAANIEKRYSNNVLLSSDTPRPDNVRVLLSSMAGTLTYSGGQYDIRAGVSEVAAGTLTDAQLGSGDINVQPRPSVFEGYNAVRGLFPDANQKWVVTDYPPYQSEFYVAQDSGIIATQQIDMPGVTSPYQAQRIARLQLHLSRNALSFEATWNLSAYKYSPGQVVNVSIAALGWDAKPFRILRRVVQDDGQVAMTMREEPAAIYAWSYTEGKDPDPAPNTNLVSAYDVEPIKGLAINTSDQWDYESDGSVNSVARITWYRASTPGVLYGGRIEIWYRWGEWEEWEKKTVPGTATSIDAPIKYGKTIVVQARAVNAVQVASEWSYAYRTATDAPTGVLTGNLLANAQMQWTRNPITETWQDYNGAPNPSYKFPGWLPTVPSSVFSFENLNPFQAFGSEAGAIVNSAQIAYMGFANKSTGSMIEVESTVVAVKPGDRMVAFCSLATINCTAFVNVRWYDGNKTLLLTTGGADSVQTFSQQPVKLADFKTASFFADAPANAGYASLVVAMVRVDTPTSIFSFAYLTRPYLGRASTNQRVRPVWSS